VRIDKDGVSCAAELRFTGAQFFHDDRHLNKSLILALTINYTNTLIRRYHILCRNE
jgi:hypothetical protein